MVPWSVSIRTNSIASGYTTNSASRSHSASDVKATAGSRWRPPAVSTPEVGPATVPARSGVQNFGDPAVDDALPVGSRIVGVDGKDLRALEDRRQARLDLHRRIRGNEVDLVLRELVLHRRRRRPVDELLPELRILGALDERDAFGSRADTFLRKADGHVVALGLGIER